ncbi:MAG: hypothetical protein LBV17_00520 [Treponema sp.]|jgi:hypothetical protein|nr:hypothetical protein [Treponema sp.]
MRFVSLTINHGMFRDKYDFSEGINIVYSKKNSVGKTTLLRFLMYSLGYQIPSIRGINFDKCECDLEIIDEKNNKCHIQREHSIVVLFQKKETLHYSLPDDLHELHLRIFGIANTEILDNLLGAYYIDQEKGWTLLNRGKVIGKIPFNIEMLIRGLSDRSCTDLELELSKIKRELQKYKYMFDVAQYQADINAYNENIAFDTPSEEVEKKIDVLYSERKPIFDEFERIKNVIRKNTSFVKYISDFNLVVQKNGIEIPVNQNTLVGFQENAEYLVTKRRLVANQLAEIDKKIDKLKESQENSNALLSVQTRIQQFDADVSKMKIDAITTERIIKQLTNEKIKLEDIIKKKSWQNNPIIFELYQLISAYTTELGIDSRYVRPQAEFIFTDDLKSLSGAIFHKIVFSFKISYIKLIFNHTGVKLPIVMDSPSGREVDKINITDMMNILERDFREHQIILASIKRYNFSEKNYIELKDTLFKHNPKEGNNEN